MNNSYVAASELPIKLLCDESIHKDLKNNHIRPIHIQINPTNYCPFNCSFCSCADRNKELELSFNKIISITEKFVKLGAKAFTISGGGEPLTYPYISEYIDYLHCMNIKIGLVTNGILLKDRPFLSKLTWCRISLSDEHDLSDLSLEKIIQPHYTDWAFSYVMTDKFVNENFAKAVEFGNKYNLTHIRLVENILDKSVYDMRPIKQFLKDRGINDDIVIYQGRKNFTRGHKKCLSSLLRPAVDADGNVFPCCGVQYRKRGSVLDMNLGDSMGIDIDDIWANQKYFDGSSCDICYYSDYNDILNMMMDSDDIKHREFV